MKSIMPGNKGNKCFICGKVGHTESHHIFFGTANRNVSERYGLKVNLCHNCHNEPPYGVHHNRQTDLYLKREGQKVAMERYGLSVEKFIEIFGRNYL